MSRYWYRDLTEEEQDKVIDYLISQNKGCAVIACPYVTDDGYFMAVVDHETVKIPLKDIIGRD